MTCLRDFSGASGCRWTFLGSIKQGCSYVQFMVAPKRQVNLRSSVWGTTLWGESAAPLPSLALQQVEAALS